MSVHAVDSAANAHEAVRQSVLHTFARLTEYEPSALALSSHLENDLGVDSIALAEIAMVLNRQFQLNTPLEIQEIKTIQDALDGILQRGFTLPTPNAAAQPAPETPQAWLSVLVRQVFATHSGYEVRDLPPDAAIEGDLGIDSVAVVMARNELLKTLGLDDNAALAECRTLAELEHNLTARLVQEQGEAWFSRFGQHTAASAAPQPTKAPASPDA
ncbi:acyl carrier protein, partial [Serratia marcescens]